MTNATIYQKLLLAVAAITVLLTGCNTHDAEYERDNPADPKSASFVHSKPGQFSVFIENEVIVINWSDRTEYNDGYIVEKAINDSTLLIPFARLPGDAEGFSDDTREVGTPTYYRISSYEVEDGRKNIIHSELVDLSINVFENVYTSVHNNKIYVRWSNSDDFIDGIRIQEKIPTASEYKTVQKYEDLGALEKYNDINFQSSLPTFLLDLRLSAYQMRDGKEINVTTYDQEFEINRIRNLNVDYLTEQKVRVEWSPSVTFADFYKLKIANSASKDSVEMPPVGSFEYEGEFVRGKNNIFITGYSDGIPSNTYHLRSNFSVNSPVLENRSKNLDSVELHWGRRSYDEDVGLNPSLFRLEKSVNGGPYTDIAELPAGQFTYRDVDVVPANRYSYRVRTLLSPPSKELNLSNRNVYTELESTKITLRRQFNRPVFKFYGQEMVAKYESRQGIYPLLFVNTSTLTREGFFDSGNEPLSIDLQTDDMKVAEVVKADLNGHYDVNIWDLNSSSIDNTIPGAHVDTENTYVDANVEWSRDGQIIASALRGQDREIKLWDTGTGELVHSLDFSGKRLHKFLFHPYADEMIVFLDSGVSVYDLETLDVRVHHENPWPIDTFSEPVFMENSQRILTYDYDELYLFDLDTGELLNKIDISDHIRITGSEIRHISLNRDETLIGVQLRNIAVIIDTESFEILQTIHLDNQWGYNFLTLDSTENNTALSIIQTNSDTSEWNIATWERRQNWYSQPGEEE